MTLTPVAHLDDDLLTIQRYKGKTNEQFTKLLLNVTLAAGAHGADWPGRRLRLLDPVCGRGTSLNHGLVYGFDVDGIEIDRAAYDAYHSFLVTWLKDKRFKHQVRTMPLRRDAKIVGRRFEVVFGRDKEEYKADDVQRVRVANDDTTHAAELYRKAVFDVVVADLPYGVQHAEPRPSRRTHPPPRRSPRRRPRRLDRRDAARCRDGPVLEHEGAGARHARRSSRRARAHAGRGLAFVRAPRRPRDHARPRGRGEARVTSRATGPRSGRRLRQR